MPADRRRVTAAPEPGACRLHADQADVSVAEERMEEAERVRSPATHATSTSGSPQLAPHLAADDRLEVADHHRGCAGRRWT